jgi:hypothetical protein
MGRGNLLAEDYQDYLVSNTFVGNGSTVDFTTDFAVDNRPIVYIGGSVEVFVDSIEQAPSGYVVTQVEPVVVSITTIPRSGSNVRVQVTYLDDTQEYADFVATGSSGRFPTLIDIGLVEQAPSTYVLDDFNPVTVTFDTAPPENHVVYIRNQRGAEDEFDFSIADGSETTFTTNIDLSLPVRVFVGGIEIPRSTYLPISLNPVEVVLDTAPPDGVEVTVLIRDGQTWYHQGVDTASDGEPLQVTDTTAARFLRGQ